MSAMSSHHQSRKRRILRSLLSSILPNRVDRHTFSSTLPNAIDGPSGSRTTTHLSTSNVLSMRRVRSFDKRHVTINILPDDVLLHIFRFDRVSYLDRVEAVDRLHLPWWWHRLIHVCRRWRSVVFAAPNTLNLTLLCSPKTCVELTGVWPPLPIIIRNSVGWPMPEDYDFDAAIVHPNRVFEIDLSLTSSQLQRLASAMQESFPALIHLSLAGSYNDPAPALPDGFSGGYAPHLQSLELRCVPFPALPKLLLSATGLVRLTLWNIPRSGYITPEAIVTSLAVLTQLKSLTIAFKSHLSCPELESQCTPPPTYAVLPALTHFEFQGVSEYLEDLVTRIDAPFLDSICITFFHRFDVLRLAQFMRRTTRFQALNEAHVEFDYYGIQVGYLPPTRTTDEKSGLRILCRDLDWQLSSLVQVFTSFFPFIYMVKHLYIYGRRNSTLLWRIDFEDTQWLEIIRPFIALKNLYLSKLFVPRTTRALQDIVGGITELLPTLQNVYLEGIRPSGPIQEGIGGVVALQPSGHPMNVSLWRRDLERDWVKVDN